MTDIKLFYTEAGQGEPLILLHGNGDSGGYFQKQLPAFAPYYHVYAVDTRGHGKTPRGQAPFTIRQFAEDLLAFMDGHGLEKAHLLGFSDGGNIAMVFALRYPERVSSLILNGANLCAEGVKRSTQFLIETGYRIARKFASKSEKAKKNAELLGLMVNEPNVTAEELAHITARTLVIAGTRDMIREEHTRLIAEIIPGAELAFVKGTHFIASKNPEAFNERVLDFLQK